MRARTSWKLAVMVALFAGGCLQTDRPKSSVTDQDVRGDQKSANPTSERMKNTPMTNPAFAVYTLKLMKALPGEKYLVLHLDCENGAFRRAFGESPAYNQATHEVDASGMRPVDGKLTGEIKVTVNPDGYVPSNHQPVLCRFAVDLTVAGTNVNGTYGQKGVNGAVVGQLEPRSTLPKPARLELVMQNAVSDVPGNGDWKNRGSLSLTVSDNHSLAPIFSFAGGSPTVATFDAWVNGATLQLEDGVLTGEFQAEVSMGKASGIHSYKLNGHVVGNRVGGRFARSFAGKTIATDSFLGTLQPVSAVNLRNCTYTLVLEKAVANGFRLKTLFDSRDGAFGSGIGYAPFYNKATHVVDTSSLVLDDGSLTGQMKVTFNPDPYLPPDHEPVACLYTIKAAIAHNSVVGAYQGTYGGAAVSGPLAGNCAPGRTFTTMKSLWIKMDDGVNNGAPWMRRVFLSIDFKDGKYAGGSADNIRGDGGWRGILDSADVKVDGDSLKGTIVVTVKENSAGVTTGAYTYSIEGKVVGDKVAGEFSATRNGNVVKTGRFSGIVGGE